MAAKSLGRQEFICFWVDYMKTHPDREWSRQQNILINSVLKTAQQITPKEYLEEKGEPFLGR